MKFLILLFLVNFNKMNLKTATFGSGCFWCTEEDFEEFKIPENVYLTSLNYDTGMKAPPGEKNSIIEALKFRDINNIDNNNLISINNHDKLVRFRQFY